MNIRVHDVNVTQHIELIRIYRLGLLKNVLGNRGNVLISLTRRTYSLSATKMALASSWVLIRG